MKKSSVNSVIIMLFLPVLVWAAQQSIRESVIAAAEQGDAKAQATLGVMYEKGLGVSKNAKSAVKWIRKAASQGDPSGHCLLGRLYAIGYGVAKNENEALALFHKAAVAELERFSREPLLFAGGVEGAIRAAEGGNSLAQTIVGKMHLTGVGVEQNDVEAVRWFTKSAKKVLGGAGAQQALGLLHEEGRGGLPKDKKEAMRLYRKVSEKTFQNFASSVQLMLLYQGRRR